MTTQEQKQLIAECIEQRAFEIASRGEVREDEIITVKDIDGQDYEIAVRYDGDCVERDCGYDMPSELHIDLWYNGETDIYEGGVLLYTLPVAGRIINTI